MSRITSNGLPDVDMAEDSEHEIEVKKKITVYSQLLQRNCWDFPSHSDPVTSFPNLELHAKVTTCLNVCRRHLGHSPLLSPSSLPDA